jgi:hypothetical protein
MQNEASKHEWALGREKEILMDTLTQERRVNALILKTVNLLEKKSESRLDLLHAERSSKNNQSCLLDGKSEPCIIVK